MCQNIHRRKLCQKVELSNCYSEKVYSNTIKYVNRIESETPHDTECEDYFYKQGTAFSKQNLVYNRATLKIISLGRLVCSTVH